MLDLRNIWTPDRQLVRDSGISTDRYRMLFHRPSPTHLLKDSLSMSSRPAPHEPGERKCLKCNESFKSQHAGNRICKKCARINASLNLREAQIALERGAKRLNGNLLDRNDAYLMNF
jgi:hypothetical protein